MAAPIAFLLSSAAFWTWVELAVLHR